MGDAKPPSPGGAAQGATCQSTRRSLSPPPKDKPERESGSLGMSLLIGPGGRLLLQLDFFFFFLINWIGLF